MRAAALAAAIALGLVAREARAEPVGPLVHEEAGGPRSDVAPYAGVGIDGAIGTTLGAAVGVGALGARADVAALADVTWMVGAPDLDDLRLRAGVRGDVLRRGPLRLQLALVPDYLQTSNGSFTARSFGTELRVAPGVDVGRWSGELQASVDQQWLTYFATTDEYRRLVYAGAKDGWYGAAARAWRVGARGAVRLGAVEVSLAAGWEQTGALDVLPPLYAGLTVSWVLPGASPFDAPRPRQP